MIGWGGRLRTRGGSEAWYVENNFTEEFAWAFETEIAAHLGQLPHMQAAHGNGEITPAREIEFLFDIDFEILAGRDGLDGQKNF